MASDANEPRAISAALAQPAFTTRAAGRALGAADLHTTRWAPEVEAARVRPLATLGFVDRVVTPWLETADHSPSLRAMRRTERDPAHHVSWVFPRPWYRDELSWLAAARAATPSSQAAVAASLHAYVAPSTAGASPGLDPSSMAYAPLVSATAGHAAQVIDRATAPLRGSFGAMAPQLDSVLADAASRAHSPMSTTSRLASLAPEMVTPPAPHRPSVSDEVARGVAERAAEQRALVRAVEQIARASALQTSDHARAPSSLETAASESRSTMTEPAGSGGLHAQARAEAIADARAAAAGERPGDRPAATRSAMVPSATSAATTPHAQRSAIAPPALAAAIGALPIELATAMRDRSGDLVELEHALRAVELLARASAAGTPFASSRGPRVVLPAGLGGAVSSSALGGSSAPGSPSAVGRPIPGLAAVAAMPPAALAHVGWADRWLARFAGASAHSLDRLAMAPAGQHGRDTAIAGSAPPAVFVAPMHERVRTASSAVPTVPQPVSPAPASAAIRYDDDAQTPDDVFAAIAASAARTRVVTPTAAQPRASSTTEPGRSPAATAAPAAAMTGADVIARSLPVVSGAGVSPQLVASPFAPVLQHVTGQQAASTFDVRGLFTGRLAASYLAELIAPADRSPSAVASSRAALVPGRGVDLAERIWPSAAWASSGSPSSGYPAGGLPSSAWTSHRAPSSGSLPVIAPTNDPLASGASADHQSNPSVSSPFASVPLVSATYVAHASASTPTAPTPAGSTPSGEPSFASPSLAALVPGASTARAAVGWTGPGMVADRAEGWSLEQQRSVADLSLDFVTPEMILAAQVYGLGPTDAAHALRLAIAGPRRLAAMAGTVDRTFIQALAQASDRASAATAMHAMVGVPVDRAIPTEGAMAAATGEPASVRLGTMSGSMVTMLAGTGPFTGEQPRRPRGAVLWPPAAVAALGLQALPPDGEHAASVAALELLAARLVAEVGTYAVLDHGVDSERNTSVAPSIIDGTRARASGRIEAPDERHRMAAELDATPPPLGRAHAIDAASAAAASGWSPSARAARALAALGRGEYASRPALERAAIAWQAMPVVYGELGGGPRPMARADDIRSSHSADPSQLSSRMASEATVLVGDPGTSAHGDDAPQTSSPSGGRAIGRSADRSTAWQPASVYAAPVHGSPARGDRPNAHRDPREVDRSRAGELLEGSWIDRPGLASLSQRAGEALGAYVAPAMRDVGAPAAERSSVAARASLEAHELVRTGRPAGRHGGGEVDIPPWFEAAARKMLEERTGASDGISHAELTLVAAAPASHIAAASRGAASTAPIAPTPAAAPASSSTPQIDIDEIANDVYRAILVMMDAARARNGEPFL